MSAALELSTYTVGIVRDFVALHQLIGGDWGRENQRHSHHYRLEAVFEGAELDRHGYLVDISVIEPRIDALVDRYRDQMLNELPELAGKNPGLERFATVIADGLVAGLQHSPVIAVTVKLWEHERAYATCRRRVR